MRKLILMVGLIVVGIACGDAVGEMMDSGVPDAGAQPTPTPVGKFVGYTSEGYPLSATGGGLGGLFNTYAACRSDFGATARICTVAEVLGTVDLPAPPPGSDGVSTQTGAWMLERLDGIPSCWGPAGTRSAPYILPVGQILSTSCGNVRVLACCAVN